MLHWNFQPLTLFRNPPFSTFNILLFDAGRIFVAIIIFASRPIAPDNLNVFWRNRAYYGLFQNINFYVVYSNMLFSYWFIS